MLINCLTFFVTVKLLAICETGFNYRDKSPPMNYVASISSNMQVYSSYFHGHVRCLVVIIFISPTPFICACTELEIDTIKFHCVLAIQFHISCWVHMGTRYLLSCLRVNSSTLRVWSFCDCKISDSLKSLLLGYILIRWIWALLIQWEC
jgi:hypothetical protein